MIEIDDDDDEPVNEEEESEISNDEETEEVEESGQSDYEPEAGETTSVLNGPNLNFAQLDEGTLHWYPREIVEVGRKGILINPAYSLNREYSGAIHICRCSTSTTSPSPYCGSCHASD